MAYPIRFIHLYIFIQFFILGNVKAQTFFRTYYNDTTYVKVSAFSDVVLNKNRNTIITPSPFIRSTADGFERFTVLHKHNSDGEIINTFELTGVNVYKEGINVRNDTIFMVGISEFTPDSKIFTYTALNLDFEILVQKSYNARRFNNSIAAGFMISFANSGQIIIHETTLNPKYENNPLSKWWMRILPDGTVLSQNNLYKNAPSTFAESNDHVMTQDIDGNPVFLIVPAVAAHTGRNPIVVVKIFENDSVGVVFNHSNYSGNNDHYLPSYFIKILVDKEGNYLIPLDDEYFEDVIDFQYIPSLYKFDRTGKILWKNTPEPFKRETEPLFLSMGQYLTSDNLILSEENIVLVGSYIYSDSLPHPFLDRKRVFALNGGTFISNYSPDGDLLWHHWMVAQYPDGSGRYMDCSTINELYDGSLLMSGWINPPEWTGKLPYLMRLGPNGCFDPECSHKDKYWHLPQSVMVTTEELKNTVHVLRLYPNPTQSRLHVKVNENVVYPLKYSIIDTQGRAHETGYYPDATADISLEVDYLPHGLYHLVIEDKMGNRQIGRFVKN